MISEKLKKFVNDTKIDVVMPEGNIKPDISNQQFSSDFSLEDLTDSYRVAGINYRNDIYQVDLKKDLLDNGNSKTQDEWIEYTKNAMQNNKFYVGDMPLYYSLFQTLFKNKDNAQFKDNIEEARKFLQKTCKDYWLMTLSRINYNKPGKDIITHDYGLQDKLEVQEDIIGSDGFISQLNPEKELKAVLGSSDINEINQVYDWISGKNAYIWRINSKPEQNDERIVGFSSGGAGFRLGWSRGRGGSSEAFGVRRTKIR